MLCRRRHAPCLHNKVQLTLATHARIDQLVDGIGKRPKVNPWAPNRCVLAQDLAKLIDLFVCELTQTGEVF